MANETAVGSVRPTVFSMPEDAEGQRQITPFPMRLLGLALVIVWDWAMHSSTALNALGANTFGLSRLSTAMYVCNCATLIALAVLHRHIGMLSSRRAIEVTAWVSMVVSTVGAAASLSNIVESGLISAICGVLAGYAFAVLCLSWAQVYARLGTGRLFLCVALSLVTAGVGCILIGHLEQPYQAGVCLAVGLVAFPLCWVSMHYVGSEQDVVSGGSPKTGQDTQVRYPFPVRPVVIMAIAGFASSFVSFALFSVAGDPRVPAVLLVGVFLLAAIVVRHGIVHPSLLVGLSAAAIIFGLICLAAFGVNGGRASSVALMTGYVAISVFVLANLAVIARRAMVPTLWLFGFSLAARDLVSHLSGLIIMSPALLGVRAIVESPYQLTLIAVVGLALLVLLAVLWISEKRHGGDWDLGAVDVHEGRHVPTAQELFARRCEQAVSEYGLTPREADVLLAILEGQSYQEICQALVLSMNTVKTHAHHAYVKLGVHTKAEARALLLGSSEPSETGVR